MEFWAGGGFAMQQRLGVCSSGLLVGCLEALLRFVSSAHARASSSSASSALGMKTRGGGGCARARLDKLVDLAVGAAAHPACQLNLLALSSQGFVDSCE